MYISDNRMTVDNRSAPTVGLRGGASEPGGSNAPPGPVGSKAGAGRGSGAGLRGEPPVCVGDLGNFLERAVTRKTFRLNRTLPLRIRGVSAPRVWLQRTRMLSDAGDTKDNTEITGTGAP